MKTLYRTLVLLCLLGGFPARACAASPALIVVLLPGTSLHDWQSADAPRLHRLMQTGALAVMNTRTAHRAGENRRETPQSALLTLGAGARAGGAKETDGFLAASSQFPGMTLSCGALYERRTGHKPRPNQAVCPDWPAVLQANRNLGYDLRLGSLADTLTGHGVTVAAGGGSNADWIAAGNDGTVRRAAKIQAAPGGCLIWDAGASLAAADAALGTAAAQVAAKSGRLIVVSPSPSGAGDVQKEHLTPILLWGHGIPAGLINSLSTRHPGLVTNTDFAPAIADYFGIERREFRSLPFGFAWSTVAMPENLHSVERLNKEAVQQAQGMGCLPFLALALGIWMLVVTLLTRRQQAAGFWALVPMTALTAALFAFSALSFWGILLGLLVLTLGLTHFLGNKRVLTILMSGTSLALMIDLVTGNPLMHHGLLGYSALEGARYYGIGNEAMGLLLGAALMTAARLWSFGKKLQLLGMGLMLGITLLLGSAGAKAGGVLVSLAVFGTFIYTVSGRRWTGRTAASLAAIITAGMAAAALGDAFLLPKSHSHIGEAVQRIAFGGLGEAADIVCRKLAVEGRLAYHSTWAALLWSGILCTVYLWKQTPPIPHAMAALRAAGLVGVLACLLFNDAGVVAAAIFAVTLWSEAAAEKESLPTPESSGAGRQER